MSVAEALPANAIRAAAATASRPSILMYFIFPPLIRRVAGIDSRKIPSQDVQPDQGSWSEMRDMALLRSRAQMNVAGNRGEQFGARLH
jgi:hypothetical protein